MPSAGAKDYENRRQIAEPNPLRPKAMFSRESLGELIVSSCDLCVVLSVPGHGRNVR
jgi:hypothetical protein